MKPLSRPMFRNGGPIKEGIMTGMKDRPGYKKGSLIGGIISKLPYGQQAIDYGRGIIPRVFNKIKPTFRTQPGVVTGGTTGTRQKYISQIMSPVPFSSRVKAFAKENPYFTAAAAPFVVSSGITAGPPIIGGAFDLGKKALAQVADFAISDRIFDQDEYIANKKLQEQIEKNKKIKSTIKPQEKITTTTPKIDRDAEIEANRKRYYKLMGIDKMQKGAAYDSLIDASKIIQEEGGDLKGSIKSGNLQNRIISAISKNLDKSADLKRQIDAAILKGEIQKDINQGKNELDRLVKEKQIKVLDNQLKGGSLQQVLSDLEIKQGKVPEGAELATIAIRKGIDIPKGHVLNTKDVSNFIKDNPTLTVVDYLNDQNLKLQQAGKGGLDPGNYVVGKNILVVGEDGTVIEVLA